MTVEVCSRVGVRVSAAPGAIKDESQPGGGTSPAHETSEAPTPRPKFMITDILAQHKPPTSTQSEGSAPPTPTIEEPKDLSLTRTHAEDDDIDLEGDASHDEDDHGEAGKNSRASPCPAAPGASFTHPHLSLPGYSLTLTHPISITSSKTSCSRRHPTVSSLHTALCSRVFIPQVIPPLWFSFLENHKASTPTLLRLKRRCLGPAALSGLCCCCRVSE